MPKVDNIKIMKYFLSTMLGILIIANVVVAAPNEVFQKSILPITTNLYDLGSSTQSKIWNRLFVNYASTTALSATNIDATGAITGTFAGSLQGGTAGMLTAWLTDSTLTATGTPTFAAFTSTSTQTSRMAGPLSISATLTTQDIIPASNLTYSLGTSDNRYLNVYAGNLYASSTVVDTILVGQYASGDLYVHGDLFADGGDFNLGTGLATTTLTSANGRLGIGTTSPYGLLSINPNTYISSKLFVGGAITATSTLTVGGAFNASSTSFFSGDALFLGNLNIGLGTSTQRSEEHTS